MLCLVLLELELRDSFLLQKLVGAGLFWMSDAGVRSDCPDMLHLVDNLDDETQGA